MRGWLVALALAACAEGDDEVAREALDEAEKLRVATERWQEEMNAQVTELNRLAEVLAKIEEELKGVVEALDALAAERTALIERVAKASGAEKVELRRALEENSRRREKLENAGGWSWTGGSAKSTRRCTGSCRMHPCRPRRLPSPAPGHPRGGGAVSAIMGGMKAVRARVVGGKITTRARFPEGARLTILMDDVRPPLPISSQDEAAIAKGIAEIEAGKGIPLEKFLDRLRRY